MSAGLHLKDGDVLSLGKDAPPDLYEAPRALAVGTRGAVSAAGKVRRARSFDRIESLDHSESCALPRALEQLGAAVRDSAA